MLAVALGDGVGVSVGVIVGVFVGVAVLLQISYSAASQSRRAVSLQPAGISGLFESI